jgi:predicted ferric reductase
VNEQLWWYVARSTGIVAWALVAAAVIWGLLLTTRLVGGRSAPRWLLDLHRFLGALAVIFTGLHLVGLVADSYTYFGPSDLLVPFASAWKPLPVALGVVAMYLLVAVEMSSLAMRRIPRRVWRWVHLTSFGSFWLASIHGILAGTDASNPVLWLTYLATASVVLFLTVFRALADPRTPRRPGQAGSGQRRPASTTASSMAATRRSGDAAHASSASGPSSSTTP